MRIDVEFTLTCAAPMIRARIVVFDEIAIRTDATAVVERVGVGAVHTVIGARLVVVGVHVGHDGRRVLGVVERRGKTHARPASVMGVQGWMKGEAVVVCGGDEGDGDEADELWFSLKVAARDRAAFARREGARELPRHARRVATNVLAYWLGWNIMCIKH